jgi:hypothetical protein
MRVLRIVLSVFALVGNALAIAFFLYGLATIRTMHVAAQIVVWVLIGISLLSGAAIVTAWLDRPRFPSPGQAAQTFD